MTRLSSSEQIRYHQAQLRPSPTAPIIDDMHSYYDHRISDNTKGITLRQATYHQQAPPRCKIACRCQNIPAVTTAAAYVLASGVPDFVVVEALTVKHCTNNASGVAYGEHAIIEIDENDDIEYNEWPDRSDQGSGSPGHQS